MVSFINLLVIAVLINLLWLILGFWLIVLLDIRGLLDRLDNWSNVFLLLYNFFEEFTCFRQCNSYTAWWIWFLTANTTVLRLLVCLSKNFLFKFHLLITVLWIQLILVNFLVKSISYSLAKSIMSDRWGFRHFIIDFLIVFFRVISLHILLKLTVSSWPVKCR